MSDDVAKRMRPYFKDYEIQVVDFAGMSDEELEKYPEETRFIAGYFRCKRNGGGLEDLRKLQRGNFTHPRELIYFLDYVVKDPRLTYKTLVKDDKEPKNMCQLIDRIIAEGEARGFAEGEARGRLEEKKTTAKKLYQQSWSIEKIADFLDVAVVDVEIWVNEEQ